MQILDAVCHIVRAYVGCQKFMSAGAKSLLGCGEMVVSEPGYVAEFGRSKLDDMVGCENKLQASPPV